MNVAELAEVVLKLHFFCLGWEAADEYFHRVLAFRGIHDFIFFI
jgi:hypothetical protein